MLQWTEDRIRFYRDAVSYGTYDAELAKRIRVLLPNAQRICDLGCGIGNLSLELTNLFPHVIAVDASREAIENLTNGKNMPENLTVVCSDIRAFQPEVLPDALLYNFFGQPDRIWSESPRLTKGKILVLKRGNAYHRFSLKKREVEGDTGESFADILRVKSIPYERTRFQLEFGQPFRCIEDAVLFFSLYQSGNDFPITEAAVRKRLTPISDETFSWYLPQERCVDAFLLEANDLCRN